MSDLVRIAEALKKKAGEPAAPEERHAALLDLLRRELNDVPPEELYAKLADLRRSLAPGDEESEASRLWDCLLRAGRSAPAAGAAATGGGEGIVREVLGAEATEGVQPTPEMVERLVRVLSLIVDVMNRCDDELKALNLRLHRSVMREGRKGGTVLGIKMQTPLKKVIQRAILETGDTGELEERLTSFARSGLVFYTAHLASVKKVTEAVRKRLDPAAIQKKHGAEAWKAYRRRYHNDLYDFGPEFEEQFVTKPFLDEYFRIVKTSK